MRRGVMGSAGLYLEQAFKDVGQGKVGPQLLVCDVVLVLAQPFCPKAGIPLSQLLLESLERQIKDYTVARHTTAAPDQLKLLFFFKLCIRTCRGHCKLNLHELSSCDMGW